MQTAIDKDLNSLIKLTGNVFDAFTAALFLIDKNRKKLVLKAYHSLSRHIIKNTAIELGHGLVGWVAEHEDNLNVSQFKHDTKTLQFYSIDEEIKSFLAVPVFLSGLEGVLCVDSKKSYVFTPKMQKILIGFAEQFSCLISRAKVEKMKEENIKEISSIYEFIKETATADRADQIVDRLIDISPKVLPCDGLFLALFDEEENECRVTRSFHENSDFQGLTVSSKNSLMGWVLRNKNSLNISNLAKESKKSHICSPDEPALGVKSFLGVPLQAGRKLVGVFGCIREQGEGFHNLDVQIASIIGYHAALSLAHAGLDAKWDRLKYIDSVTGFYNIRFFSETIDSLLTEASKSLGKLGFIMVKPDHLEKTRERFGYGVRDGLLKKVAEILKGFLKKEDIAVRYSEESFLLVVKKLDREKVKTMKERIKNIIEQTVFVLEDREISTTVSVGMSLFPFDGSSKEDLVDKLAASVAIKKNKININSLQGRKTVVSK